MRLLLATHNRHKRREFARLLGDHEVQALPEDFELPPEDGETFEQNALGKARAAAALARERGALAIADDSGIEAQALGGAPGVRSARYAGEGASDAENLAKLLREAPAGSGLRYVCALAVVDPASADEQIFHGYCEGSLAARPRGTGGFGYDPAFVPAEQSELGARSSGVEGAERTMAQLSDEQKDRVSHRGRAARALRDWLAAGPRESDSGP